jgi:hypothetical protein
MDLPPLVLFHGDWDRYVEELYDIYMREVVKGHLTFRGLPVKCQYRPSSKGKGYGFWHVISNGPIEEDRVPDLRRCERIKWIPWLIRNVGRDPRISWWCNKRGSNTHVVIWIEEEGFAVIFAKRSKYYLLKTAYCVTQHRKSIFQKEREQYWKP